jgi:hypothetical protein
VNTLRTLAIWAGFILAGALALMWLLGALHTHISAAVPPCGYLASLDLWAAVVLLQRGWYLATSDDD